MKLKLNKFSVIDFLRKNLGLKQVRQIGLFRLLFFLSKGFDAENVILYSLNNRNYKDFLPDAIRYRITLNSNRGYWPVLHDKLIFYKYLKDQLPTPVLEGVIFNGKLTSIQDSFDYQYFFDSLTRGRKYILKPLQGGKGRGILFLSSQMGNITIRDKTVQIEEFKNILSELDEYGIFRFHEQHELLNEIYSFSINTVRLVTMYDYERKEPFLYAGLLRIGWSGSRPFDNFSQGGLVSLIEDETGTLSAWKRKGKNFQVEHGERHPDTNANIKGVVVPHWSTIKREIMEFLKKNPMFDYVGWDILIGNEGYTIIEANHNPDMDLMQIFRPFMKDERVVRYFKQNDIYEK